MVLIKITRNDYGIFNKCLKSINYLSDCEALRHCFCTLEVYSAELFIHFFLFKLAKPHW